MILTNNSIHITCLFMVICLSVQAQEETTEIRFTYDNSGNRISRDVISLKSTEVSPADSSNDASQAVFNSILQGCEVRVYPNPTKGQLSVEVLNLPAGETFAARIYSSGGIILLKEEGLSKSHTLDLSGLGKGMYILQITLLEGTTTWKILKE
jgi:YD repeat-containing protein